MPAFSALHQPMGGFGRNRLRVRAAMITEEWEALVAVNLEEGRVDGLHRVNRPTADSGPFTKSDMNHGGAVEISANT